MMFPIKARFGRPIDPGKTPAAAQTLAVIDFRGYAHFASSRHTLLSRNVRSPVAPRPKEQLNLLGRHLPPRGTEAPRPLPGCPAHPRRPSQNDALREELPRVIGERDLAASMVVRPGSSPGGF